MASYLPCHCSTNDPARHNKHPAKHVSGVISAKKTHQHSAQKRRKTDDDKPGDVRYPEPIKWMHTRKKSEAPTANHTVDTSNVKSNSTSENCSTAECLCERTCHPKAVTSVGSCIVF